MAKLSQPTPTSRSPVIQPGLGIELIGLVTDSERKNLRSLTATKPNSSIPKPGYDIWTAAVSSSLDRTSEEKEGKGG